MYVDSSLPRHLFGWRSPRLGLEMPIVSYGDRGHPVLLLPTAQADYLENERFWLIKAIETWNGKGCLVVNMAPQPAGRVFNGSDKTIHGVRIEMKTSG